jgi:VIT1/CCC1 family predicted Fe2+/Mn2+ transporter
MALSHSERHRRERIGWLGATVLGAEVFSSLPIHAALASAGSFAVGAIMPLLTAIIALESNLIPVVSGTSLIFLAILGSLAARAGGASVPIGAMRVTL